MCQAMAIVAVVRSSISVVRGKKIMEKIAVVAKQ